MFKQIVKKMIPMSLCLLLLFTGCTAEEIGISDKGRIVNKEALNLFCLPQIDSWPGYMVSKDEQADPIIHIHYGKSGSEIFTDLQGRDDWDIASMGVYPALMMLIKGKSQVIGAASNEAAANLIIARDGDPVFNHKANAFYGASEEIKNKTFLVPASSTASLLLHTYLAAFELTEADVHVETMDPDEAAAAFKKGKGDYLVIWSPYIYDFLSEGYQEVVNGHQLSMVIPMVYLVDSSRAEEKKASVKQFFENQAPYIDQYAQPTDATKKQIENYFKAAGVPMKLENLDDEILRHHLYDVTSSQKMMSEEELEKAFNTAIDVYHQQGKFSAEDMKRLKEKHYYIHTQYLK